MRVISAKTKISALIKAKPEAIEAIASINVHFKKLQNPFLRKFLAPRVTIAEAAIIGRCKVEDFFEKLKPLGFIIDYSDVKEREYNLIQKTVPQKYDVMLDVRADITKGNDPFKQIMAAVAGLQVGEVLLFVNSFEPAPLIRILNERRYETTVLTKTTDEIYTYIKRTDQSKTLHQVKVEQKEEFADIERKYEGQLSHIDVRSLPMPQPMIKILDSLKHLQAGMALFVYHKKIPVYLLPELKERNFLYVLRENVDGIELIIYHSDHKHDTT
jgi:uncharacterized protein (DUF2249 family)